MVNYPSLDSSIHPSPSIPLHPSFSIHPSPFIHPCIHLNSLVIANRQLSKIWHRNIQFKYQTTGLHTSAFCWGPCRSDHNPSTCPAPVTDIISWISESYQLIRLSAINYFQHPDISTDNYITTNTLHFTQGTIKTNYRRPLYKRPHS